MADGGAHRRVATPGDSEEATVGAVREPKSAEKGTERNADTGDSQGGTVRYKAGKKIRQATREERAGR